MTAHLGAVGDDDDDLVPRPEPGVEEGGAPLPAEGGHLAVGELLAADAAHKGRQRRAAGEVGQDEVRHILDWKGVSWRKAQGLTRYRGAGVQQGHRELGSRGRAVPPPGTAPVRAGE